MGVFPNFRKKYNRLIDKQDVPKELIKKYKELLPIEIIKLWKKDGFCGYAEGLLWTINPEKYLKYIPQWLELRADSIPIMRTAFGDLIVYCETNRGKRLDIIDVRHQDHDVLSTDINRAFEKLFCNEESLLFELKVDNYNEILQKLGQLRFDECYGYEPILALGGEESIKNIKIVKYDIHLDLLTQTLKDYVD